MDPISLILIQKFNNLFFFFLLFFFFFFAFQNAKIMSKFLSNRKSPNFCLEIYKSFVSHLYFILKKYLYYMNKTASPTPPPHCIRISNTYKALVAENHLSSKQPNFLTRSNMGFSNKSCLYLLNIRAPTARTFIFKECWWYAGAKGASNIFEQSIL